MRFSNSFPSTSIAISLVSLVLALVARFLHWVHWFWHWLHWLLHWFHWFAHWFQWFLHWFRWLLHWFHWFFQDRPPGLKGLGHTVNAHPNPSIEPPVRSILTEPPECNPEGMTTKTRRAVHTLPVQRRRPDPLGPTQRPQTLCLWPLGIPPGLRILTIPGLLPLSACLPA